MSIISRLCMTIFPMNPVAEAAVAAETDRRGDRRIAQIAPLVKIQPAAQDQKLHAQDHGADKEVQQFHRIFGAVHQNP